MKYMRIFIFVFIMALLSLLISCGVNSPTAVGSNNTMNNSKITPTITAYQGTVHQTILTGSAIGTLLSTTNPANITKKQQDILTYYKQDIEQGAYDEDYLDLLKRTPNHFMDPQHGNLPLSDPPSSPWCPNPVTALTWMYYGDENMYIAAKAEYIKYITMHPIIQNDTELSRIMKKLGHVLHMCQDMTSPPHVRNDAHPPFA